MRWAQTNTYQFCGFSESGNSVKLDKSWSEIVSALDQQPDKLIVEIYVRKNSPELVKAYKYSVSDCDLYTFSTTAVTIATNILSIMVLYILWQKFEASVKQKIQPSNQNSETATISIGEAIMELARRRHAMNLEQVKSRTINFLEPIPHGDQWKNNKGNESNNDIKTVIREETISTSPLP